jgi:hypothetical protein
MLVIDVLKMLIVLQMEPVVIGPKNIENVFLSVPLPQQTQQHHHHQNPVPLSLFVNAWLIPNADGANTPALTLKKPLLLRLLLQSL